MDNPLFVDVTDGSGESFRELGRCTRWLWRSLQEVGQAAAADILQYKIGKVVGPIVGLGFAEGIHLNHVRMLQTRHRPGLLLKPFPLFPVGQTGATEHFHRNIPI